MQKERERGVWKDKNLNKYTAHTSIKLQASYCSIVLVIYLQ